MPTEATRSDAAGVSLKPSDAVAEAPDQAKPERPFTSTKKEYDPQRRAFHRLRSPSYDTGFDEPTPRITRQRSSGRGYDCGCRSPQTYNQSGVLKEIAQFAWNRFKDAVKAQNPVAAKAWDAMRQKVKEDTGEDLEADIDKVVLAPIVWLNDVIEKGLFGSYMPSVPSWVPVNRVGYGPDFVAENAHNVVIASDGKKEGEVEVEGRLTRSYLTRHHRVYTQWSRFHHWSFQVDPAPGFRHLIGAGNTTTLAEDELFRKSTVGSLSSAHLLYAGQSVPADTTSLECLLDLGTFSRPPGDHPNYLELRYPSCIFDQRWPFWPQTGDWFWAAGRYVYDCAHATREDTSGDDMGLHPTLINPVKAFAVARYEACEFEELDTPVPGVRFMFFATKRGGYWDFNGDIQATDCDYEFAVDLPPLASDVGEFAVGRAPQFMRNTIVVRPRLLKRLEFAPFGIDTSMPEIVPSPNWWAKGEQGSDPLVQLTQSAPGTFPRMVKVKVPMSSMPKDRDVYAFVLTLAWYTPEAASTVKKVFVKLPKYEQTESKEHIRLIVGINGRWIYYPLQKADTKPYFNVRDGLQRWPGDEGLVLYLPPDGKVTITAHGTERFGYGQFMEETPSVDKDVSKDRQLRVGGLIPIDKKTLKIIRDALKTKLSDIIPYQFWQDHPEILDQLDDDNLRKLLSSMAGGVFGERRIVGWKTDVDTIDRADPSDPHGIACAVAREMKFMPVAFFNKANDPLGMIDMPPTGHFARGVDVPMKEVLAATAPGKPPMTFDFVARRMQQIPDSNFVYFRAEQGGNQDYTLSCSIAVAEPDLKGTSGAKD